MTDFRMLCAELVDELDLGSYWHNAPELKARARAALAEPEPEPIAWMYEGEPDFDGKTWRENLELTFNERLARWKSGEKEPVPLFVHHVLEPIPTAEPKPAAEGEVAELVKWLRSRAGIPCSPDFPAVAAYLTRAADLLERLAVPEPQGDLIPDRYSGYQKTIYKDGFHAGYKHRLNSASAALAQSEPEPPADGEVVELVAWLLGQDGGIGRRATYSRIADLLERLAVPSLPIGGSHD